ncbi:SEC-C metal-binding domain-containing protein [Desulfobacter curvatus]|uniref:SEC-C metal-binding domain-containing protein n=1 Tax=Desulfobacter curvatus TaxID=2290 RepID=UPI00035D43A1|nr:SEC-C metal-binding domain-containing protein [Desulfobacter curvatus]
MNRLWNYEDYVKFLSHDNSLVRKWAFDAVEKQYPNKYTDEVSRLISDEDSHLACVAPGYLAKHHAIQHAPAILNSFLNDSGNIPSNCALALSKMKYEPALETIIDSLSDDVSADSLFGLFNYLGTIHSDAARETLISAVKQIKDPMLQGNAIFNLLRHDHQEDIAWIIELILKPVKKGKGIENYLIEALANYWSAGDYFNDLTKNQGSKSLIKDSVEAFDSFFYRNDHLSIEQDAKDKINLLITKRQYHDLITTLMFEAQNITQKRYPEKAVPGGVQEFFIIDSAGVFLFKELSKQPSLWHKLKASKNFDDIEALIAFVLSVYFAIIERTPYVKALLPGAEMSDLIRAIQNAGSKFPEELSQKIVNIAPVDALRASLSDDLNTWGDIKIVKIMGQIGKKEFVPELLRVLNDADSLDYIYGDAITALNALDESADELILTAAQNNKIKEWELISILEHLPYPESFELIMKKWNDENSEIDSYEMFAYCLRGIGDPRGIAVLQDIYNNQNSADYVGRPLECLSLLHNADIPELPAIRTGRREEKKRQELRAKELNGIFSDMGNIKNKGTVIPFQKESKKIGRNDPCPCGSGKKYKKCCLNKS